MARIERWLHYRWVILFLAFLTTFMEHLLLFSYAPLLLRIMSEMNLTYTQAGFIFPMCIIMIMVLRIPWGLVGDRVGSRLTIGLAITLMGFSGFLRSLAVNYWTLLMVETLFGVGVAAIMPCLPKLAAAWFPHEEIGFATGIYVAGFSIGNMLGLGFTPHLLLWAGTWRGVFRAYGIFGLMFAALWWVIAREPVTSDQASKIRSDTPLAKELATLIKMKDVWVLMGLLLCAMGSYDTICYWLPSILELKGIPTITASLVTSMLPLGFLAASLTVGILSDRMGLRRPFLWILGLISGPAVLAIEKSHDAVLWGAVFISGFCTMGVLTIVLMILAELPELAGFVASAGGWVSSLGNIGSLLMPAVAGYIKDVTGSFLLGMVMIAIVAEITLVLGLVIKETGERTHR